MAFRNLIQVAANEWVDPETIIAISEEILENLTTNDLHDGAATATIHMNSGESLQVGASVAEVFAAIREFEQQQSGPRLGEPGTSPVDLSE